MDPLVAIQPNPGACPVPTHQQKVEECKTVLRSVCEHFTRSVYDDALRSLQRSRLEVDPKLRKRANKYAPAEYKRLYYKQRGLCCICEEPMAAPKFWPGALLDMHHKDPNEVENFDAEWNRGVAHKKCNEEMGAKSLLEQSKEKGATILHIITR